MSDQIAIAEPGSEKQKTFAQSITQRPEFKDSFDLGRAISFIDGLLRWPNDDVCRRLAKEFLIEMKGEES